MRIEPPKNESAESTKGTKLNKSKRRKIPNTGKSGFAGFLDVLYDVTAEEARQMAEEMLDDLINSGNEFARSPTERNLRKYKENIKKFLQFIERGLYKINESLGLTPDYKHLHMVAQIVDQKLMDLAKLVFNSEKKTIELVSRIEEINGLLVDLYR
ncbi:MAG: uncharacterized protein PWQ20_112 [Thermotogaceae bacterium]|nr:uncharacterized protein [Thermotogaceae bacterium]MDN5337042.1 uncharacterized protein [Thermotogaceae bacterium]